MSKGDELKFEGGAATKAEREYGNDGGKNRIHAQDCMAAAQKSLGLPDIWSFEQGHPVYRIADAIENAPHLGMGKSLRQTLLLRKSNLFLNSPQSVPSVLRQKN